MTLEEDLAIIRLRDRLLAEAKKATESSTLSFRAGMVGYNAAVEAASAKEQEMRKLERQGSLDRIEGGDQEAYWKELDEATKPDGLWKLQEETYNVHHRTRPRPPPAAQESLPWL